MTALTLTTERLTLRRPNPSDGPAVREFFVSPRAAGIGGPFDLGKSWRSFAAELGHWEIHGFGMWTVTRTGDDQAVALVGPWCPADWPEREIGWMIFSPDLQGTGIAREAARAALDHAFHTLGWDTAVSYIDHDNPRSIALAERLGARLDPDAPTPHPDKPCLVYRHPKPGARS